VNGRVNGAVRGARVVLHPGAVVDGDVTAKSLLIDDGASFEGRVTRATDPEAITPQVEAQLVRPDRQLAGLATNAAGIVALAQAGGATTAPPSS
jgi:cytoskeletal protein CcmA (bactofilin family)